MVEKIRQAAVRLLTNQGISHACDVRLAEHTWMGVGGAAAIWVQPKDIAELAAVVRYCDTHDVPWRVLGEGANVLIGDAGLRGMVLRLNRGSFVECVIEGETIRVGAGCDLAKLILETARRGLAGLEVLGGVPASIGGALRMNAGGKFGQIADVVQQVRFMDHCGEIRTLDAARGDLQFDYRKSNLTEGVIIDAELRLTPDDPQAVRERLKRIMSEKKAAQPLASDSAGCVFKNPEDPANPVQRLSAGALIDQAGCKAMRIGGASISTVHANFIVTEPGTTASDILQLIDQVQQTVHAAHGVELETELVIWDEAG